MTTGQKQFTMSLEDYNKVQLTLGQVHAGANALARQAAQIAQYLDDRIIEIVAGPGATGQALPSVSSLSQPIQNSADPTTTAIQAGPQ